MTTHQDYCAGVLSQCEFGEWRWRVSAEPDHSILQVCASDRCARTGEPFEWSGRKWRLSVFMTKSEMVQTAFMAVLAAVEHEARERFLYRGQAIFGPHYDVDALVALCAGDTALDVRPEVRP